MIRLPLHMRRVLRGVLRGMCTDGPPLRPEISGGSSAANIPVLTSIQALEAAAARRAECENAHLVAMYSSYHGGIITEPGIMALPVDDHMANRGHGMFDTGSFRKGRFYRLTAHVERILRNAERAGIKHGFTKDGLIDTICQTVRVTGLREGSVRYFLTAGHGGFSWTPEECVEPGFYCVVIDEQRKSGGVAPPVQELTLEKEFTADVRYLRPQFLAQTKSNNYLLNVMIAMESKAKGGAGYGIWVGEDDLVIEGAVCSAIFVNNDNELITPRTDIDSFALEGTTVKRVLAAAEDLVKQGKLAAVAQRDVTATEVKGSLREMFLVGGDLHFSPIGEWDGISVGAGMSDGVGPVCKEIYSRLLDESLSEKAASDEYGSLYHNIY